ncbi:GDP-mannose pyrophosphatase NudK [Chitinophaga sp. 212800010-3]|uniref:GDP-mannose pyrophosphatase NudK n=1 Tax=unclassified Chitinophaga TaxID=2619133 RepID=UPI002DEEABEA|nr:GDP-mannose pyrophosphatase [Chitinophaga sp. 212800010-3]
MNPSIQIKEEKLLSDNWYLLRKITYHYQRSSGQPKIQTREVYDRGNGAAILLYDSIRRTVILTRQFRLPTYVNGNTSGMLIEVCAGLLDNDHPEDAIRREAEEETGYQVKEVRKVYEAYMSPGSVTEILYFFIAEYTKDMQVHDGGGLEAEQEDIEVMEITFEDAWRMMKQGTIRDGKTIMLLQHLRLEGIL